VPQSQVDGFITDSVEPTVVKLPDEERDEFLKEIREFLVATQLAQAAAISQIQSSGVDVTEQAVGDAVNGLWAEWADEAGVELDPRFGTWQDMNIAVASGSLSVPAKDDAASTSGPASRPCGS